MFTFSWFVSTVYYEISMLLCVLLVAFRMPKRPLFWLRVCIGALVFFGVMAALQRILSLLGSGGFTPLGLSKYIVYYLLAVLFVCVCFDCNFWAALFCATVGYCLEHFGERLYEIVNRPFLHGMDPVLKYLIRTVLFAAAVAAVYLFLIRRSRYLRCNIMVDNKLQTVTSVIVVAILVYVNSLAIAESFGNILAILYINIMSLALSFMGIVLECGIAENKNNEKELAIVERILQEERERYKVEKENFELLGMRCHDLRHRLADGTNGLDGEMLTELKENIAILDSYVDTGNDALNVVLYKKMRQCEREGISLSCLVDGRKLDFIPKHELYSLFGNALDNAIAAVKGLPEEMRVISVVDTGKGDFVNIQIENYFSGDIHFVDSLPQTREDPRFHGFGVKSMRYIVEKYGGMLRVYTKGDVFIVEMLFPDLGEGNGAQSANCGAKDV